MILYIERSIREHPRTKSIIEKFPRSDIITIEHYKNIFDKPMGGIEVENLLILAELRGDHISTCPSGYDPYDYSYFFKSSIGCIFDCGYCYLKWAFRNPFRVIFVNYEEIQRDISEKVASIRESDPDGSIIFYASDYSDIQAIDTISGFNASFIPFFESLPGVTLETRTKSSQTDTLLSLPFIPRHTEVAYSLNPEEIIEKYEHLTAPLDARIRAINTLIDRWFRVGLRFLPLLPIPDAVDIYRKFLDHVTREIPLDRVSSFSIGSLLYTKADYREMRKKVPEFDILYQIEQETDDAFVRLPLWFRIEMYRLFREYLGNYSICLDGHISENPHYTPWISSSPEPHQA